MVEGDPGNSFYIIRSGEVNCTTKADGQVSVTLTRGKFFGELALLHNAPRAATVTATTTVQVLTLDKEQFTRCSPAQGSHLGGDQGAVHGQGVSCHFRRGVKAPCTVSK